MRIRARGKMISLLLAGLMAVGVSGEMIAFADSSANQSRKVDGVTSASKAEEADKMDSKKFEANSLKVRKPVKNDEAKHDAKKNGTADIASKKLMQASGKTEKAHWASDKLSRFKEKKLIKGYSDGSMKPDENIRRSEFITLINNTFNFNEQSKNVFEDVKEDKWYSSEILKGKAAGYLNGYEIDGKMYAKPDDYITREEASTIIAKVFSLENKASKQGFKDEGQIAKYAKESIDALYQKGYISGYNDRTFKPKNKITRAEAVTVLSNAASEIFNSDGKYAKINTKGNMIVNTGGIILEDVNADGNLYLTQGIGNGEVTIKDSKIKGKVFVRGGGINSIYFINTDIEDLYIDKKDGKVRVVLSESTQVQNLNVLENAKLEIEKDARVERLNIRKDVDNLDLDNKGTVKATRIDSKNTKINGKNQEKSGLKSDSGGTKSKVDAGSGASRKSNKGKGKNSSGNTSSKGSDSSKENSKYQIIDSRYTKLMEVEGVLYMVVLLKTGSVDDYEFYIDSKAVEMERVNVQGTILKSEVKSRNLKELKIIGNAKEEKISISKHSNAAKENEEVSKEEGIQNTGEAGEEKIREALEKSDAKLMEIEGVMYVVVVLNEGSIKDHKIYVDGSLRTFKPVNTQGTILKLEVTDRNEKEIVIEGKDKKQTFKVK